MKGASHDDDFCWSRKPTYHFQMQVKNIDQNNNKISIAEIIGCWQKIGKFHFWVLWAVFLIS